MPFVSLTPLDRPRAALFSLQNGLLAELVDLVFEKHQGRMLWRIEAVCGLESPKGLLDVLCASVEVVWVEGIGVTYFTVPSSLMVFGLATSGKREESRIPEKFEAVKGPMIDDLPWAKGKV